MIVRSLKIATAIVALTATTAAAQKVVSTSPGKGGSPHETVEWTVGAAKVTVTYGRPSLKGRKVLEEVAPAGKIWRTGADAATTLTTDKPLMIGSLMIPAGTHTVYTIPDATSWKLVVSKQTGQWGTEYNADRDLGRTDLKVEKLPQPAEQLTIGLANNTLTIDWGTTRASAPVMVH
jgi:hypothetical protein